MPVFMVSYDLHRPGQQYERLLNTLEHELQGRRVLHAQWAVRATGDAKAVLAHLRPTLIDMNDRLLVMDRDSLDWAGLNLATRLEKFEP
jgi:hypothetical protein